MKMIPSQYSPFLPPMQIIHCTLPCKWMMKSLATFSWTRSNVFWYWNKKSPRSASLYQSTQECSPLCFTVSIHSLFTMTSLLHIYSEPMTKEYCLATQSLYHHYSLEQSQELIANSSTNWKQPWQWTKICIGTNTGPLELPWHMQGLS